MSPLTDGVTLRMVCNFVNFSFHGYTMNVLIITPDIGRVLKGPGVMMDRKSFVKSLCCTNVDCGYGCYDPRPRPQASPHPALLGIFLLDVRMKLCS